VFGFFISFLIVAPKSENENTFENFAGDIVCKDISNLLHFFDKTLDFPGIDFFKIRNRNQEKTGDPA